MSIPDKVVLDRYKALADPNLRPFLLDNFDFMNNIISVFDRCLQFMIIHERCKGTSSFWFPYFQVTKEHTDIPLFWDRKDIEKF